MEGVDRQVVVTRVVRVANENGLGCGKQDRQGFDQRDGVGVKNNRNVEGLLFGDAEGVGKFFDNKNAWVGIDGAVQFPEVCAAELV